MNKLLLGIAIVIVGIFSVSLATASTTTPTPLCSTSGQCTGTLWFADDSGLSKGVTTASASITFNQYATVSGVPSGTPKDLFYGTLTYGPTASQTTVNFSAIRDFHGGFSFNGTTSDKSEDVRGGFKFSWCHNQNADTKPQACLDIHGAVLGDSAVSFVGVISTPSQDLDQHQDQD